MEKKSMNDKQQDSPQEIAAEVASSTAADDPTKPSVKAPTTAETPKSDAPTLDLKKAKTGTAAQSPARSTADISTSDAPNPDASAPKAKTAPEKSRTHKTTVSKLAILALLLALIALAIIGYGYTLIQQLHTQQTTQLSGFKEQLSSSGSANRQLQQQNGQILGELKQMRSASIQQQSNVDELQTRLSKSMQQVSKLGTGTRKDWLLAEVEYLLRLANQRVLMEGNASGALSLLQGADQILKETDDVSIYPVRKALAQDMVALESVPTIDIEGIFLKLNAINNQVDSLRLLPITDKHQLPEILKQITPDSMSQVNATWASAMDKLGNLIVIRHREDAVTPLLSPEQHYFLTQNLHLMLEQTQQSLLQGKQAAFDAGLKKSAQWIGSYFEATDPTTRALLRNLSDLEGIEIAPALPDISGSLRELKSYLAELHNLQGATR
ncbi:MAG: uroporphyrin-3 C-methyltransferase [Motiliproteus sp.]|jgi:uroporphyrin-3 C-methyltransferase